MKLRTKLTAVLLGASLASAAIVGGIAYWLLMRDFRQSVMERAFDNFSTDVTAYLTTYGSWQNAERSEPFDRFVRRRHRPADVGRSDPGGFDPDAGGPGFGRPRFGGPGFGGPGRGFGPHPLVRPSAGGDQILHNGRPPFIFLLLDPDGRVIKPGDGYVVGDTVPKALLRQAQPITVRGVTAALALPLGTPNLSPQDRSYLSAMRRALISGFGAAGVLAVVFGLLFGHRTGATLRELTTAIRAMRAGGELQQAVPVRSRDEIGALATAFNTMSAELAAAHRELRELSIRDPLTQLYNRRHFGDQTAQVFEQARRFGHPLTVMLGDLDHFKRINDGFSHAIGDEVLRRIGRLLRDNSRKSDIVARLGGEEFAVVFVETPLAQAINYCERLRALIESQPWHEVQPGLGVTMSMGLCADTGLGSIEKMLHAADANLYAAKRAGRNRVEPRAA